MTSDHTSTDIISAGGQSSFSSTSESLPSSLPISTSTPSNQSFEIPDEEFSRFITNIDNELTKSGYTPLTRGIHSQKALDFNANILGAPEEVMQILKHGYIPAYHRRPAPQHLPNNKSASLRMNFCVQQVKEWEQAGFVRRAVTAPRIVSPLTVAVKHCPITGEEVFRCCLDGSRSFNLELSSPLVHLEDLRTVLPR